MTTNDNRKLAFTYLQKNDNNDIYEFMAGTINKY